MFVMEFPNEGTQPCHCWSFMVDNGKTNDTSKRQFMGCMRHKEVLFCSQGALAQYLFHRFQIAKHPWPHFKSLSLWDRIKLLEGTVDSMHASHHNRWEDCQLEIPITRAFCGTRIPFSVPLRPSHSISYGDSMLHMSHYPTSTPGKPGIEHGYSREGRRSITP